MPKETVWGELITVRVGDLPVLRARSWNDLADVTRPRSTDSQTDSQDNLQTDSQAALDVRQTVRVRQTLDVRWGRDERQVSLFTAAHDHDAGEPVDLGGHWINLDWSQLNKLIRKLRVARDQAFGTPE